MRPNCGREFRKRDGQMVMKMKIDREVIQSEQVGDENQREKRVCVLIGESGQKCD